MTKALFALAAVLALPLSTPASSQVPAQADLDGVVVEDETRGPKYLTVLP